MGWRIRGNRWKNVGTLAGTGTVIGNAAAISDTLTVVTGADDAVGVILPSPTEGDTYFVYQAHATSGLKVYPPVNGTINDGSANASITMEGKSLAMFVATNSDNYAAIFTANS